MAYATHDQLGSWGEDAAERAMQQELDLQNRIEAGVDRHSHSHSHSHSDRRGAVRDRGDEGSDDDDGDDDDQQERDRQRVSLLEEAFKAFDVDGDDYMTWDEFYAAFLKKRMLDDRRFLKLSRDEIRSIYDAMPNVVPSAEFAGVPYLCPAHPVRAKFVDFSGYVSFTTATNADKRKKAAAAGEKTFRQYDPAVEGGVGFEGLLDADGGIGPNKAFDIPPDGVQEEERWPMPQRINNRRPTLRFPSKEKMNELWKKHDYNGNGLLSQSEAKEVLEELWPALARNTKTCDAVLRMAYNACDDGCGDGLVDRKEFPTMLEYVQYFSRMFSVFSEIDESGDGNIELSEFYEGCKAVGLTISDEQAEIEFQSIDEDGGGYVSFMEFCAWVAKKQMGGWHRAKVVATASMAADAAAEAGRSHQGDERGEGADGEMMAALGGTALAPKGADADAATTISSTKAAAASTDGLSKGQAEVQKVLSQQASNLKQVVCWNCRQPGHTAAYCPEARMVGTNRDRNKLKLSTTIHSHRLAQKRQEAAQSVAVQHAKEQARQKLFENDVERDFAALQNHPAAAARVPATAATRETTRVIRGALHR
jgi:Ca2+-binding EF-hand superfamily protein